MLTYQRPRTKPIQMLAQLQETKAFAVLQLMRIDRPVGTFLLLWPTLAALWLVSPADPSMRILLAFISGTFIMRAAGCVINDVADRHIDPHIDRTKKRPIADGRLNVHEALTVFAVLLILACAVVWTLNTPTQWLAAIGLLVAAVYPLMKRFTNLPQVGLGIAFSWGILMASTAMNEVIEPTAGILFVASFFWIIAYDTEYAMVDREDDVKVGVQSTAILAGKYDVVVIAALLSVTWLLLTSLWFIAELSKLYLVSLVGIAALFVYQVHLIRLRERGECFKAFRNNTWVGFLIFVGVFV